MTNEQRLMIIASIKRLISLAGENAAPKTQAVIAGVIIELSRLEDSLMQKSAQGTSLTPSYEG